MTAAVAFSRAPRYIAGHYFLTNLGYFGLLSTLVVMLSGASFDAAQIALLVTIFTITSKVAKIPLAPWLDRFRVATSALVGCLLAAGGFLALRVAVGVAATALALAVAGVGVSVNALASKQLAAAASDGTRSRAALFSLVNTAVNVASAVAAPVSLALASRHHDGYVLLGIAAVYCAAGLTTFVNYARLGAEQRDTGRASLRSYLTVLRLPGFRSFLVINCFGWLLYGQLFTVLSLHVSGTLGQPGRLGWLYTLNALLVVVFQLGVTRLTERWTGGQLVTVARAYVLFALAFLAAYLVPGYLGSAVFVVVFTLAEMMFVPSVDVLLLGLLGGQSRAIGYSILSISTALGESIGGGVGVVVYRQLQDHGAGREFWLVAGTVALAFAGITRWLRPRLPGLHPAARTPVR